MDKMTDLEKLLADVEAAQDHHDFVSISMADAYTLARKVIAAGNLVEAINMLLDGDPRVVSASREALAAWEAAQ